MKLTWIIADKDGKALGRVDTHDIRGPVSNVLSQVAIKELNDWFDWEPDDIAHKWHSIKLTVTRE